MDRFGTLQFGYDGRNPMVNRKEIEEEGIYEDDSSIQPPSPEQDDEQDIESMALIDAFKKVWDIEDLRFTPVKNRLMAAWHLYHMTYETNKDADQSDKRYPAAMMYVERIVSQFMRMIDQSPNWFRPVALIPQQQAMYNLVKRLINCITDRKDGNNLEFWAVIEEAFKSGVMTGQMITQIVPMDQGAKLPSKEAADDDFFSSLSLLNTFIEPEPGSTKPVIPNPLMPRLSISNLPAENFLMDSSGSNRYRMWTQLVPVATVFQEAEARGYDLEALRRAKKKRASGISDSNKYTQHTREGLGVDTAPPEGFMRLHFFEGTLPDPIRGPLLFTNKFMVMANGCEIILKPTEIPFWDGCPSTVFGKFIAPPHAVYGKGLLSENADSIDVKNNVINQLLDWVRAVLCPGYEEDQDKLDDEELRNPRGMFPGRIVRTRDTNGAPVYRPISPGELPQSFWNVFQVIDSYAQSADGTNGQMAGGTRTRGRITADEFQTRQAESGNLFWGIFQNLERFLSEILRLYFVRTLQYIPDQVWKDWVTIESKALIPEDVPPEVRSRWEQVYQTVAEWDAVTRYRLLGGYFSFSIRVFSALAERQAEIEKITFTMRSLAQVPGAIQLMNMRSMIVKLAEAFGWDPEEVLRLGALPVPDVGATPPNPADPTSAMNEGTPQPPDLSQGALGALSQLQSGPNSNSGVFPGGPRNPSIGPEHPVVG